MTLDIPTQFPHGIFLASIPLSQTWFPVLMNIQNTILLALQNIQPAPAPLPTPAPAPASPKEIGTKPLVFTGESHDLQRFHQECDLYLTLNSGVYNIVDKKIMLIISLLGPGLPMIWKTSWLDSKINAAGTLTFPTTITTFWTKFESAFEDKNEADNALHDLDSLQQGSSTADEHIIKFKLLLSKARIPLQNNDHALINLFQLTLNCRLATRILSQETPPTTFQGWYNAAAKADGNWRRMQALLRPKKAPRSNNPWPFIYKNTPAHPSPRPDPNAMDVDTLYTTD